MDDAWWKKHIEEVRRDFIGETYSSNDFHGRVGIVPKPFTCFGNSGAGAVALAIRGGATRVIMLGFDCKTQPGKTHWHGGHPPGLTNASSLHRWPRQFGDLRAAFPDIEIINCSRITDLNVFPRATLEDALRGSTMIVTAVVDFQHDGKHYKRGDTPNFVSSVAAHLKNAGCVSFDGLPAENPHQVGGQVTQSSASPPAPASPQPTLNAFDAGETPKKTRKQRKSKKAEEEE